MVAEAARGVEPPRQVVDMAGRKVDLPAKVNRIVTTFKPATLCVLALGLGDRLVGVDPGSTRERLQISVIPALAKAAPVGDKSKGVNFEAVVSLKPDLVVLYAQSGGPELAGRLASLGYWLLLAAVGSVTLMAATNQMCQDMAVVPFLCVVGCVSSLPLSF